MTMMCTAAWRSWPSEDRTEGAGEGGGEREAEEVGGKGEGEYPLRPQSPAQTPVSPEGLGVCPPSRVGV